MSLSSFGLADIFVVSGSCVTLGLFDKSMCTVLRGAHSRYRQALGDKEKSKARRKNTILQLEKAIVTTLYEQG